MPDKVLCPWCGAEMNPKVMWHGNETCGICEGWMQCWTCGAQSPYVNGANEQDAVKRAYDAAQRRPMIKPLTLNEIRTLEPVVAVYLEHPKHEPMRTALVMGIRENIGAYCVSADAYEEAWVDIDVAKYWLSFDRYGKRYRLWERKPTDEEREAAKWDD